MTFPLPQGVCRKVCRPTRNPPRIIRASEVFRIARAAKRNGEGPCTILSSAYRAVPELGFPEKLKGAALALAEAATAVNDATMAVLEDIATLRGARVIFIWRILSLLYDLSVLVSALNDMSDKQMDLIQTARTVANCLEITNVNRMGETV